MNPQSIRKSFIIDLNDIQNFKKMFETVKNLKVNNEDIIYVYVAENWNETILICQNFPQNFNLTYLVCHCPKEHFSNDEFENLATKLRDKIKNIINVVKPRKWSLLDSLKFKEATRNIESY